MPELTELQRLAEGTTEGPWEFVLWDNPDDYGRSWRILGTTPKGLEGCYSIAEVVDGNGHPQNRANAAYIAAMSPDTAKKLIAVALAAKYVAYSNGFDAALPDKLASLRTALEGLK